MLVVFGQWPAQRIQKGDEALFQISLFGNRMFASGVCIGFLFQLTIGGLLFVLPVFLQSALQLNALDTAQVVLPYALNIFTFALGASRLLQTIPATRIVQIGLFLMLIGGSWVYRTASLESAWTSLIAALF